MAKTQAISNCCKNYSLEHIFKNLELTEETWKRIGKVNEKLFGEVFWLTHPFLSAIKRTDITLLWVDAGPQE